MNISLEQKVLLHLLKQSLTGDPAPMPEQWLREADWQKVFREACAQAVALQSYDAVGVWKTYLPAEVWQQWFQAATKIMRRNMQVQLAQNELVSLLARRGLSCYILKGTSSARFYPRPELRTLGDIDFLIDLEQEQAVRQCLLESGCTPKKAESYRHAAYMRGGIPYEMHFEIPGLTESPHRQRLEAWIADLPTPWEQLTCDISQFTGPTAVYHGLIILQHMLCHMLSGGFGLRHLCDWAAFIRATAGEPFWPEQLVPLMQACGTLRYASVISKICADWLGAPCPDWCEAVEPDLPDAVLLDVLNGGNFGRKELDRSRESAIVSMKNSGEDVHPVRKALQVLHGSTPQMYPVVKKCPILHPVFDLFRGVRYLLQCLTGRRRWIAAMLPAAKARQSVYERLRIYE